LQQNDFLTARKQSSWAHCLFRDLGCLYSNLGVAEGSVSQAGRSLYLVCDLGSTAGWVTSLEVPRFGHDLYLLFVMCHEQYSKVQHYINVHYYNAPAATADNPNHVSHTDISSLERYMSFK
jgi:hypothetical protein